MTDTSISANDVYRALPPTLARDLHAFCKATGDEPGAVLADALQLHLDELGPAVDAAAIAGMIDDVGADIPAQAEA